ncbi:MAG: M20/M25/M40 family metallo-hydrolase [Gammaproteobacteria bacterium]|nr:M20/M25/M40 family metallo-hydrolase [Gammaproteobacteria bacterium]
MLDEADRFIRTATSRGTRTIAAIISSHNAQHGSAMLQQFREFLSLPNISSDQQDMLENAAWIERYIRQRGFDSQTVTAGRAPYVIAERMVDANAPTVLVYAHFDGQPVQAENWASPPFEPTLKQGNNVLEWERALSGEIDPDWRIYARSAGDDKAPVIALMHAIDALVAADVPIAVNLRLILDGEEEVGSPTLEQVLADHADKLAADVMLFCDGPMHQSGQRQLVFGVRGSATMHLTMYGPNRPLHSGHYGGWAPHPTDKLIRLLATLKDEAGNITVDGYSDDVRKITRAERRALAALPSVDAALADDLALARVEGAGRRLEQIVMRPAIIIKGISGGGTGAQSRNIIVPQASASLNLRLVPDQSAEGARRSLEQHFRDHGYYVVNEPPDDSLRRQYDKLVYVDWRGGYRAFRSSIDSDASRELQRLLSELDGKSPLLTPTMGGSLPIYLFEQALPGMPIIILPVANHDNNQHGRDENIRLQNLFDAVAAYAAVLSGYSPN